MSFSSHQSRMFFLMESGQTVLGEWTILCLASCSAKTCSRSSVGQFSPDPVSLRSKNKPKSSGVFDLYSRSCASEYRDLAETSAITDEMGHVTQPIQNPAAFGFIAQERAKPSVGQRGDKRYESHVQNQRWTVFSGVEFACQIAADLYGQDVQEKHILGYRSSAFHSPAGCTTAS